MAQPGENQTTEATQGQLDRFALGEAVAQARITKSLQLVDGHPVTDTEDFPLVTVADVEALLDPNAAAIAAAQAQS